MKFSKECPVCLLTFLKMQKGKAARFTDHVHMGEKPKFKSFLMRMHQASQEEEKNNEDSDEQECESLFQKSHYHQSKEGSENIRQVSYSTHLPLSRVYDNCRVPPIEPHYTSISTIEQTHDVESIVGTAFYNNNAFGKTGSFSNNETNYATNSSADMRRTKPASYSPSHSTNLQHSVQNRECNISYNVYFNSHITNHGSFLNFPSHISNNSPVDDIPCNTKLWQPYSLQKSQYHHNLRKKSCDDASKLLEAQDLRLPNNSRRLLEELICDVSSGRQRNLPQLVPTRQGRAKSCKDEIRARKYYFYYGSSLDCF